MGERQLTSAETELCTESDTGVSQVPVPFSARSRSGPPTWGQLHMWRPMQWFGEASAAFNLRRVLLPAPPGVPLDDCLAVLRRLVEQYQILRTRIVPGPDGPEQQVAAEGTHLVEVHPVSEAGSPEAVAERLAARLAAVPFRLDGEWPVRFGLVCRAGRVRAVAVVCSHVALDGWALERLVNVLGGLLAGGPGASALPGTSVPALPGTPAPALPSPVLQPLDQAAHERSEAGRRQDLRAMRYWRTGLAELPDVPPFPAVGLPADPAVQQWAMTSTAVAAASLELAERTRTSSSAVLLTLAAIALSVVRGCPTVAVLLIAANRHSARGQRLATAAAQDGLLVFERTDVALEDAVRTVYQRSTRGYLRAQYDPDSLASLLDEAGRTRRYPPDLSGYFNDARNGNDWSVPAKARAEVAAPGLRSRRGPSFVHGFERHDMSFCLALTQRGRDCRLSLLADTAHLPQDRIPALLSGLETVLCTATEREVGVAEVPAALGLDGLPGMSIGVDQ